MTPNGRLEGGEFIKLPGDAQRVYYVDAVTGSGAHLILMSGMPAPITTRKKVTKVVMRHDRRHKVISAEAYGVTLIDRNRLDMRLMTRRIEMARKQSSEAAEAAQTQEAPAASAEKVRETQRYILSDKAPKESMKGQGRLVYDQLKLQSGPVTVGELTKAVVATGQLTTRQDAERVVGFYLSKFKREGIVSVQAAPAAAEAVNA